MSRINHNKDTLNKEGNIFIPIGIVVLVIVFVSIFLVYYQVNIIVENIRQDLFYTCNNAILSFDTLELAYRQYTVDQSKTKQVIEYLLNKNYTETEGSIRKIELTKLKVTSYEDKVVLDVEVKVTFKSVINTGGKNEHNFKMKENIKIALMEYKVGE